MTPDFAAGFAAGALATAAALLPLRRYLRRTRRPTAALPGHCVELVIADGRLIEFAVAGTRDDGTRWHRRMGPPPGAD